MIQPLTDAMVDAALAKFYAGLPLASFPASARDDMRAAVTAALALLPEAKDGQFEQIKFDLNEALRAVLHLWGPLGAHQVTRHVLLARRSRDSNAQINELEKLPAPPPAEGGQNGLPVHDRWLLRRHDVAVDADLSAPTAME